jgi:hypothetical protein
MCNSYISEIVAVCITWGGCLTSIFLKLDLFLSSEIDVKSQSFGKYNHLHRLGLMSSPNVSENSTASTSMQSHRYWNCHCLHHYRLMCSLMQLLVPLCNWIVTETATAFFTSDWCAPWCNCLYLCAIGSLLKLPLPSSLPTDVLPDATACTSVQSDRYWNCHCLLHCRLMCSLMTETMAAPGTSEIHTTSVPVASQGDFVRSHRLYCISLTSYTFTAQTVLLICWDLTEPQKKTRICLIHFQRSPVVIIIIIIIIININIITVANIITSNKHSPWRLVRERTMPTEWPPLLGEVNANSCG